MLKTKVAIIGAGIAGISAAIYLKLAGCDFLLIDGNEPGGKLNEIKEIQNFPGLGSISGEDFKFNLIEQAKFNDVEIKPFNVQTILKEENGFTIVSDQEKIFAEKVILATGNGVIQKTIPGEEKYAGSGVSYCAVCDGNFFKGLDVAVIGDGNTAIEEAIYLGGLANKVYIICSGKFSGPALNVVNPFEIIENAKVEEIIGDDFGVTGIIVNGNIISVSGVFPYVGKKSTTQILSNIKPLMDKNLVIVNESMETNIDGLYAAGDVTNKKLKQLVTAASDGAIAAVHAIGINI